MARSSADVYLPYGPVKGEQALDQLVDGLLDPVCTSCLYKGTALPVPIYHPPWGGTEAPQPYTQVGRLPVLGTGM